MMNTVGLRINMPVRVTYSKAEGVVKTYDGKIDEIDTNSILVVLDAEPLDTKPEYRRFTLSKIQRLMVLN